MAVTCVKSTILCSAIAGVRIDVEGVAEFILCQTETSRTATKVERARYGESGHRIADRKSLLSRCPKLVQEAVRQ